MQTQHEASGKECRQLVLHDAGRIQPSQGLKILHCEDSSREGFGGPIRAQPMQATRNRDDERLSWSGKDALCMAACLNRDLFRLSCHVTAAYMSVTG